MNKKLITLISFSLLLYLMLLGNVPLLDPDEPVYGETAKEMLATGDFLSPRIYGDFWYDKPPLFYWLEAASFSLFGVSTLSARLPSALLGAACVVYLYRSARKIFSENTAFLGAFIFASMLETSVLARSAVTDMTLTFALTVAMMSFLEKKYVTAYVACGLALLAKGPIGFGFPALIVGLWLLAQKKFTWRPIMALRWTWGIPLACAVGLPWYLYMAHVHGADFINTFLGYHNLVRFAEPEHVGKDHWWLYLVVLAAGCFPWSGAAAGMLSRFGAWRRDPARLYLFVWAGFIFIFFSLSSTQLFSYIFPALPPLALLSAMYLIEMEARARKIFIALHLLFILATAAAIILAPLSPIGGNLSRFAFPAVLLLLGAVGAKIFLTGNWKLFAVIQGALALLFTAAAWTLYVPAVTEGFTSAHLSRKVLETEKDARPVYLDPFYRPAAAFYHDFYGEKLPIQSMDEIQTPCYILVQKKEWEELPSSTREKFETVWEEETGVFLQSR